MSNMEVEQRIIQIMASTFGVDASQINSTSRRSDLRNWDSLGQLRLVMQLEAEFGVSFSIDEIPELNSVEEIKTKLIALKSL